MVEETKYYVAVGFDDSGTFIATGADNKSEVYSAFVTEAGVPASYVLALDRSKFKKPEDAPVVEVAL